MTVPVEWIGIAGPTAAGKTAAALAVAQALPMPVEIVSVDSALVYRGMDIGTAKPTRAERARVPHHLIDVLDPAQSYSPPSSWPTPSRSCATSARAAACRCWWAARCCTSRRCSKGSTRCPRRTG